MPENTLRILGVNPGTKYLGLAVFLGPELRDWGLKTFKGKWSKEKMRRIRGVVSSQITKYGINILVIKKLHPSRSSTNLKKLVIEIKNYCRKKGLKIFSYSIQELEANFSDEKRINKKTLAELLAQEYPEISRELTKERKNKNPYFWRLFEAVALGSSGYYQNGKNINKIGRKGVTTLSAP